jgi:hypothetical protein
LQNHHHHQHNATPSLKSKIFTDTRTKIPNVPSNSDESKEHKTEEILQQERNPPDSLSLCVSLSLSPSQYHHTRAHPTPNPNFQELPQSAQKAQKKTVAQVSS